ncbi:thioredoxin [Reichenbachiella carrageenanivorans]|uniref:Thioredoxin n=2 Tax=Reichenbachiella carrageenanivorans TaxID=2979869 RepID=A0ABY6D6Y0_9BACT|nr:thioredoxin [Reichenbachiella carrageenanivorans]UXX81375.1 thioredoxin [Reichenbachiella carrageenanivorans]
MATFSDIIHGDQPVLVDFYADWCGPCQQMAPVLSELKGELNGQAQVIKVDVDKNQKVSQVYQIRTIPTMILFKKGKILWRHSGTATKAQLKSVIAAHQ